MNVYFKLRINIIFDDFSGYKMIHAASLIIGKWSFQRQIWPGFFEVTIK